MLFSERSEAEGRAESRESDWEKQKWMKKKLTTTTFFAPPLFRPRKSLKFVYFIQKMMIFFFKSKKLLIFFNFLIQNCGNLLLIFLFNTKFGRFLFSLYAKKMNYGIQIRCFSFFISQN